VHPTDARSCRVAGRPLCQSHGRHLADVPAHGKYVRALNALVLHHQITSVNEVHRLVALVFHNGGHANRQFKGLAFHSDKMQKVAVALRKGIP